MKKTNAMRLLDQKKVEYKTTEYKVDEADLSATHAAKMLGVDVKLVYKTLVLRAKNGDILIACIPGAEEIDLKALAKTSGHKKIEMIKMKELLGLTGYIRGGVSPLGMKKQYKTYLEESMFELENIYFSAGERGKQIYMSPSKLEKVLNAKRGSFVIKK
ncbi:MAG: Cys-tRNA(Pro) deacylase [Tissierellales bacterium]|nr:Cys-tRNA(Pro) deacylase [Tissierellales bacterium]